MSESGVTVADVEACIKAGLEAEKMVVIDVSSGCGSKFEIYISSPKFEGVKLLDRHRLVNGLLTQAGLMAKIHAVTIKAWLPTEWEKNADKIPAQPAA